jgi:hypothetical protein
MDVQSDVCAHTQDYGTQRDNLADRHAVLRRAGQTCRRISAVPASIPQLSQVRRILGRPVPAPNVRRFAPRRRAHSEASTSSGIVDMSNVSDHLRNRVLFKYQIECDASI